MFSDYLSKQERVACIKTGALAYAGMLDAALGPLPAASPQTKEAGAGENAQMAANALKSLYVLVAAGAGVPLGVFGHVMGRRVAGKRLREEELKEKIRLYRMAADEMASGLPGGAN